MSDHVGGPPAMGAAFLLAQLGAHASARYADKVAGLDLDPAQTGVLHLIARQPGQSQQSLAAQLGVAASKVVSLIDGLESRHVLERRRSTTDRRNYALYLTEQGQHLIRQLREVAIEHEADLSAGLDADEHRLLTNLLRKVADQQGLTPGVHPGYRRLATPPVPRAGIADRAEEQR
ncbi:MAG: putative MarR family transcriptional regulator [Modestobacter sp.]|jgi:DNA-binding MarR family transcriptional regulator|nr:putative MarR family transcriptional regulator [Modestobacter sp.]